jgi:hypothetical protein
MSDVSAFGITVDLPTGWDGSIAKRPDPRPADIPDVAPEDVPEVEITPEAAPETEAEAAVAAEAETAPEVFSEVEAAEAAVDPGTENPVTHIANFPLPPIRGDYGSGAVERMGPTDILICLVEFDAEAAGTELFATTGIPEFTAGDFSPNTMQRTIAGMCGAQAFFTEAGRAFSAYVVLGSFTRRAALVPTVNELLADLEIEPA